MSKYGVFPGPHFPALGLNKERSGVFLHIQSECGKIRTRKKSVFGHFPRSAYDHRYDQAFHNSLHGRPKFVQYNAYLAITGAIKGKSKEILSRIEFETPWASTLVQKALSSL